MKSELVIHKIADGSEQVIFETDDLIEAPNWSLDGSFLIVNGGGRIFRLDLDNPSQLHLIDTGGISHCNNDHGISPDGTTLVISDSPGRGTSCIYTLPIGGGEPTRVTPNTPSYWHGWSPDGTTLTYCAVRGGNFNIFTIPVEGGEETQLTFGAGHKDGPDYTPDGEWIWFNSDHHGVLPDLFRVRPNGSDLEQMTDDGSVNWFPHPSPDGATVLYLAYPPHVEGHPRGEDVALKLVSPTGGEGKTIAEFHGGQGSINVPCWAPDGTQFAYVRYSKA
ncbi:WD40-like Beta Propeller Repeat [Cognatiyoonia sediminum]|uniref:WD40-like Beta Propeller Repeat n=1 Tax=Cognatiyoonia sediminum TaxID=1508389 RepID=A0A1M5RX96_9RHOB|nr:TolB family protein [Cognatiyoonia sediminum]SHH30855.1 WD40-like Beta Propeller Repeat [Cognatiyoonia sediminum]